MKHSFNHRNQQITNKDNVFHPIDNCCTIKGFAQNDECGFSNQKCDIVVSMIDY